MKKILLVEDSEAIQKGLKYSLEQEKFVVELASDVKTAKDKLAKSEFNLIILDVMLPDGSGFELCRDIKKNMTTPILFLTAKSPLKTTRIKALEWYLFIVINKKIGGEQKMNWDEVLEWLKRMMGLNA